MKYLRVILIVLLLVCCALWVASYWKIMWFSSDDLSWLQIGNGTYAIGRFDLDPVIAHNLPNSIYGLTIGQNLEMPTDWWPVFWVITGTDYWVIRGYLWLPTLLLALPLAISASPWARRRRRAKQGLCIRCGYDLSGIDHTLCPECGSSTSRARQ